MEPPEIIERYTEGDPSEAVEGPGGPTERAAKNRVGMLVKEAKRNPGSRARAGVRILPGLAMEEKSG